jgi:pseudaminic acid synthase
MENFLKTKIVAEISANHNGSIHEAKKLIEAAAQIGVKYVKIQTYTPDTITLDIDNDDFRISSDHKLWPNRRLYDLYREAHTPWDWHRELFELGSKLGVTIFSSPFDQTAVQFLESLNCPIYKIASLETGDISLIKTIAKTGKPIFASTGASTLEELDLMVETIYSNGNKNLTLLLCTSAYPTEFTDVSLNRMDFLQKRYKVNVGLSDHTIGDEVAIAAVAKGAKVIEKHFILNKDSQSPDSAFSLTPEEFLIMIRKIQETEKILGKDEWNIQKGESFSRGLRRSLIVFKDVLAGEIVSEANIGSYRPNIGIEPKFLDAVIGKKFKFNTKKGSPLLFEIIED